MRLKLICLFAILTASATAAQAQTVNRCESASGKIIYSDSPCAADSKKAIEVILNTTPLGSSAPAAPKASPATAAASAASASAGADKRTELQIKNEEFEERRKARARAEEDLSADAVRKRQEAADAKAAAEKAAQAAEQSNKGRGPRRDRE